MGKLPIHVVIDDHRDVVHIVLTGRRGSLFADVEVDFDEASKLRDDLAEVLTKWDRRVPA